MIDQREYQQMKSDAQLATRQVYALDKVQKPQSAGVNIVFALFGMASIGIASAGVAMTLTTGDPYYVAVASMGVGGVLWFGWRQKVYDEGRVTRHKEREWADPPTIVNATSAQTRYQVIDGTETKLTGPFTEQQAAGLRKLARSGNPSLSLKRLQENGVCSRNDATVVKYIIEQLTRNNIGLAERAANNSHRLTALGIEELSKE